MRRSQAGAKQTVNGDYEDISYYTFEAVDYVRQMSWKEDASDPGRIGVIENGEIILNYGNKTGKEDMDLLAGRPVVVMKAKFKLVAKT